MCSGVGVEAGIDLWGNCYHLVEFTGSCDAGLRWFDGINKVMEISQ